MVQVTSSFLLKCNVRGPGHGKALAHSGVSTKFDLVLDRPLDKLRVLIDRLDICKGVKGKNRKAIPARFLEAEAVLRHIPCCLAVKELYTHQLRARGSLVHLAHLFIFSNMFLHDVELEELFAVDVLPVIDKLVVGHLGFLLDQDMEPDRRGVGDCGRTHID